MHTHLFTARYMPLAGVIADLMGKDESDLADKVAALLNALTDTTYEDKSLFFEDVHFLSEEARNEHRIDRIWKITRHEMLNASGSSTALKRGEGVFKDIIFGSDTFSLLRDNEISGIVADLATIDYAAENVDVELEPPVLDKNELRTFGLDLQFGNVLEGAERSVKKALRAVTSLMDPEAWGERENYLEFFLIMLNSEEAMVKKLND